NDDVLLLLGWWQLWHGLRPPSPESQIMSRLTKQPQGGAVEHPADQLREQHAHAFGGPLRHVSAEQRKNDDTEQSPQRYAQSCCRHEAVYISAPRETKPHRVSPSNNDAERTPKKRTT